MNYRFVKRGTCEKGEVKVGYFCEHCGDMKEPSIVISNGGTWYCDNCHDANDEAKIPNDVIKKATKALADEYEFLARKYEGKARRLRAQ